MQTDTDPLGNVPNVTADGRADGRADGIIPFDCFFLFIELRSVRSLPGKRAYGATGPRCARARRTGGRPGAARRLPSFLQSPARPATTTMSALRFPFPHSLHWMGLERCHRGLGDSRSLGESGDNVLANQLTGEAILPTRAAFLCPCTSQDNGTAAREGGGPLKQPAWRTN